MKLSPSCILIFIGSWLGGSILIFFILNQVSDFVDVKPQQRSSKSQHLRSQIHAQPALDSLPTPIDFYGSSPGSISVLPDFRNSSLLNSEDGFQLIVLDWPLDDKLFATANYLSLDSLLSACPNASFRVYLPVDSDSMVKKRPGFLSPWAFVKYQRRGFDIHVVATDLSSSGIAHRMGQAYWNHWRSILNSNIVNESMSSMYGTAPLPPYHLSNYIRLTKLWRKGGMFSDFSFFFLQQFPSNIVDQGFILRTHCGSKPLQRWQVESSRMSSNSAPTRCHTSTVLAFRRPKSRVLQCLLSRYDDEAFSHCLEADLQSGGATCVLQSYHDCFSHLGLSNDLRSTGTDAIVDLFGAGSNAAQVSRLVQSSNWSLSSATRAFWLGDLAWSGSWFDSSVLPAKSLLRLAASTIQKEASIYERSLGASCFPQSIDVLNSTVSTESKSNVTVFMTSNKLNGSASQLMPMPWTPLSPPTCSRFTDQVPYLANSGALQHLSWHTGVEAASCAPTFVLAGFLNSRASALMLALNAHPKILPHANVQLGGPDLTLDDERSPRCYSTAPPRRRLLNRAWCFPYVSPEDGFISSDASLLYSLDPNVPLILNADNPRGKVIFVVRHPVDCLIDQYKQLLLTASPEQGAILSLEDLVEVGLMEDGKFGELRKMIVNGSDLSALVNHYYYTSTHSYPFGLKSLFMNSLAVFPIDHYARVLGPGRVMAVREEDLNPAHPELAVRTVNSVLEFLGLCPSDVASVDVLSALGLHFNEHSKTGPQVDISTSLFLRLNRFFAPFVDVLELSSGLNVSHWRQPTYRSAFPLLPDNSTDDTTWFDLLDKRLSDSKLPYTSLVTKLLQPSSDKTDNGFNTTMGLFTMF